LAHIQPENLQNVQKMCFWQKAPGVNGLMLTNSGHLLPQIYALNKVMTDLENENFRKFMEEHSAETLPV